MNKYKKVYYFSLFSDTIFCVYGIKDLVMYLFLNSDE